jgi:hypothetical protein
VRKAWSLLSLGSRHRSTSRRKVLQRIGLAPDSGYRPCAREMPVARRWATWPRWVAPGQVTDKSVSHSARSKNCRARRPFGSRSRGGSAASGLPGQPRLLTFASLLRTAPCRASGKRRIAEGCPEPAPQKTNAKSATDCALQELRPDCARWRGVEEPGRASKLGYMVATWTES